MSSANWFAKKMGTAPPPTPPQPPPGTGQVPVHQPGATAYQQQPQQPQQADPNAPKPGDPNYVSTVLQTAETQGGQATKSGAYGLCPGCQGDNYFSPTTETGGRAKPRCMDCGYPMVQFGSDLGTGGSLQQTQQTQGAAQPARGQRRWSQQL